MNRQRLRVLLLLFFLGDVLGMLVTGTTSLLAVGTVFVSGFACLALYVVPGWR